jgi:hypothetical protein
MISYILDNGGILRYFNVKSDEYSSKFNPSICCHNEKLIYSLRESNYVYNVSNNKLQINVNNSVKINSNLFIFDNISDCNSNKIQLPQLYDKNLYMYGVEDCRLFSNDGKLMAYGTVPNGEYGLGMQLFEVDLEKSKLTEQFNFSMPNNNIEKNWMYIPDTQYNFIYWLDKGQIIQCFKDDYTIIDNNISNKFNFNNFKGSSKLVRYKDGFICLAHKTKYALSGINSFYTLKYEEYICYMDENFNILKIAGPINFSKSIGIQFAPGLEIFNNKIYITFAIGDCIPFELSFDIDLLDDLFNNKNSLDKVINKDDFTAFLTNPKLNIQEYSNIFNSLGNLSAGVFLKSMI